MLVLIFGILMTGMGVLLFIFNSRIIQTKSVQYDNQYVLKEEKLFIKI